MLDLPVGRHVCNGVLLALMVSTSALPGAEPVVVPNLLTDVEGNLNNSIPWSDEAPVRYQQVYLGTEVGSRDIWQIRFRQEGASDTAFFGTIPNVTILLSSTTAGPDTLGLSFSGNLGADATVVYDGPLTLSGQAHTSIPTPFDIAIHLESGFLFDDSLGDNLLLDVTIAQGPELAFFDAESDESDSVSRVYCWTVAECVTMDEAMIADSVGLVTMFLPEIIFADGFESGDTTAWSESAPPRPAKARGGP